MTDTASQLAAFLKSKGLSSVAIEGILGNVQVESGFNPAAYNANEGAIGFAQWERGRRTALDAYAASRGTSETDPVTQENFLWSEATGPYAGTLAQLQAATDPAQAAAIWDQGYEGSSGSTRGQREAAAQNFAANGITGGPATTQVPGGATSAPVSSTGTQTIGFLTGGVQPASWSSLLPWNWGKDLSSAQAGLVQSVTSLTVKVAFIGGGLGLVLLGAYRAAAPARDAVEEKAGQAAQVAAVAA
jgi:hypothetical protein